MLPGLGVFSPYRCRNCNAHFEVISERFRLFVIVIIVVSAAIAILTILFLGVFHGSGLFTQPPPQQQEPQ